MDLINQLNQRTTNSKELYDWDKPIRIALTRSPGQIRVCYQMPINGNYRLTDKIIRLTGWIGRCSTRVMGQFQVE